MKFVLPVQGRVRSCREKESLAAVAVAVWGRATRPARWSSASPCHRPRLELGLMASCPSSDQILGRGPGWGDICTPWRVEDCRTADSTEKVGILYILPFTNDVFKGVIP